MENITFSEMKEEDLDTVTRIYNYYVTNSTATFHTSPLSREAMRQIVFFTDPKYRTFVIREGDALCGYVLLTRYKNREAYDGTAEVTIYLHPDYIRKGTGQKALRFIEGFARSGRNFHSLVSLICGENAGSIGLFESAGYTRCACFKEVGEKFGRYLDMVAYQKVL